MSKVLDQPRYKCALAAMQTIQSIPGAVPILHSGPGCASKLNDNSGSSGHFAANAYPCTLVGEKEVVFGGIKKLRSTVENALKAIDDDEVTLYFINSISPVYIKDEKETYIYMILPINLS